MNALDHEQRCNYYIGKDQIQEQESKAQLVNDINRYQSLADLNHNMMYQALRLTFHNPLNIINQWNTPV